MNSIAFFVYINLILINMTYGIYSIKKNKNIHFCFGKSLKFHISLGDLLAIWLICFLIIIASNTTNIPDYLTYKLIYESSSHNIESGYQVLQTLAHTAGLNFETFRFCILLLSFVLMFVGLKKLRIGVNIPFSIYAIYPFTMDVIQYRNMLAISIIIFSVHYLMKPSRGNSIRYIVGVLIAVSVHVLSIVYLLLLIANYKSEKRTRRQLIIGLFVASIILAVAMKLSGGISTLIINYMFFINSDKAMAYSRGIINWGFLYFWIMHLGFIASSYFLKDYVSEDLGENLVDNHPLPKYFIWINLAISCTFPLCLVNINFYRIYRNLLLFNYVQSEFYLRDKSTKHRRLGFVLLVATIVFNIYMTLGVNEDFTQVFMPFFEKVK